MVEVNGVVFKKIAEDQVEWLKENYHLKITEIKQHMGISDETVYKLLKALGVERERHWKRILPNTEEAIADLMNPYLSHVKIAEKYGVHETAVGHRRKALGVTVRRNMSSTRLEDAIEKILYELDLAYIPQKQIGNWSIDFYLGRRHCIDVHGEWAHSRDGIPERDTRKARELADMGYKYLVIHERDLDKALLQIQDFTKGFPPQ